MRGSTQQWRLIGGRLLPSRAAGGDLSWVLPAGMAGPHDLASLPPCAARSHCLACRSHRLASPATRPFAPPAASRVLVNHPALVLYYTPALHFLCPQPPTSWMRSSRRAARSKVQGSAETHSGLSCLVHPGGRLRWLAHVPTEATGCYTTTRGPRNGTMPAEAGAIAQRQRPPRESSLDLPCSAGIGSVGTPSCTATTQWRQPSLQRRRQTCLRGCCPPASHRSGKNG